MCLVTTMEDQYHYVELYLDSSESDVTVLGSSNTDAPTFTLTTPIYNIAFLKILEAEIPFSYYVINTTNNTFTLTEPLVGSATVTVPVGNYTSTTLTTVLANQMTAASVALGSRVYTVTFSTQTQKFTVTTNFGSLVLTFTNSLQQVLGMLPSNTSVGLTLVAPNTAQITGDNYVYVCSTNLSPLIKAKKTNNGPEIARIPMNVNPGEICYYQDIQSDKWFNIENNPQLHRFDLFLRLGKSQNTLTLNGQPFSLKIALLLNKT